MVAAALAKCYCCAAHFAVPSVQPLANIKWWITGGKVGGSVTVSDFLMDAPHFRLVFVSMFQTYIFTFNDGVNTHLNVFCMNCMYLSVCLAL